MIRFLQWIFLGIVGSIGFLLSTVLADCIYCVLTAPKWWGRHSVLTYLGAAALVYLFLCVGPLWYFVRWSFRWWPEICVTALAIFVGSCLSFAYFEAASIAAVQAGWPHAI